MLRFLQFLIMLSFCTSASAYTLTNFSSYFSVMAEVTDAWAGKINDVNMVMHPSGNSGSDNHATKVEYGFKTDGGRMITNAVKYVFNVIDTDKDGFITLEEFEAYVGTLSDEDSKKFKNLSSTKDGYVSLKDFATF